MQHNALPRVAQSLDFTCGAACFESMYHFLRGESRGELYFAKRLGALDLGYTPPENIVALAQELGFTCELKRDSTVSDLAAKMETGTVVFVTWWDEDAGHYSLVKSLDQSSVLLMDPWTAREGLDNRVPLEAFVPNWKARGALMICVQRSET